MEPIFQLSIVLPEHGSNALMHSLHVQLRSAIADGRLAPGVRLPSTRRLAGSLGVSRNTVIAAYELLQSEGYVAALSGAGTRVALLLPPLSMAKQKLGKTKPDDLPSLASRRLQPKWQASQAHSFIATAAQPAFDFRLGTPDQSQFPLAIWNRLSARTFRNLSRRAAQYDNAQGSPALREAIASHVSVTRAVACAPRDVLVTAGAQQAFDLLARVLVTPGCTVVAVENPGYPPCRDAFATHGASLAPVPLDREGMVIDQLPKNARVICLTPSHQFPTGVVMSAQRRAELLAFAAANEACIVEDDYDSEFRFGGRPLDALQTLDRKALVFYVGTFSKSLFPALRLGFIIMPPWASAALIQCKRLCDWHVPTHTQETLASFIREGHFGRHVRKMHRIYAERRQTLLQALQYHCGDALSPTLSVAGLHIGVRYQARHPLATLLARASANVLAVEMLSRYAFGGTVGEGIALGYGAIPAQQIDAGVAELARILEL